MPVDLKTRTKEFALAVVHMYAALPKKTEAQVLGRQLLRSTTSVGAHYREAHRAKSAADFISKMEGGITIMFALTEPRFRAMSNPSIPAKA